MTYKSNLFIYFGGWGGGVSLLVPFVKLENCEIT